MPVCQMCEFASNTTVPAACVVEGYEVCEQCAYKMVIEYGGSAEHIDYL